MTDRFVQVNGGSRLARSRPVGYVIREGGCWEWVGAKSINRNGMAYGNLVVSGRARRAHRWMYESVYGSIPQGLVLDHLCRNTICVNPAHLEAVTNKENLLRGVGAPAQNARKSRCKRGHEFTRLPKQRGCLECLKAPENRAKQRARDKARYWRNAEKSRERARAYRRRLRGEE